MKVRKCLAFLRSDYLEGREVNSHFLVLTNSVSGAVTDFGKKTGLVQSTDELCESMRDRQIVGGVWFFIRAGRA